MLSIGDRVRSFFGRELVVVTRFDGRSGDFFEFEGVCVESGKKICFDACHVTKIDEECCGDE